ncbi:MULTISPECIES: TetR/AcrR family transcriptional regulator [Sphingomonadales]|jgi:AcrR family transcriptional regulator|uniref:TetR family transcriptional regulator n=1 Tax=Sphingobium yanoikuyae TaxID=13690 RepID=A0A291N0C3_SPHYA|nr:MULTISPECIES: TetR/AcrR family transcriptional regulator [Sphingomonadaceae]ATI80807.1 TetR family transcriptional regulator [Sphingobium yanoikuyae]MDR6116679.1 AcrR family transcriptional regulator [Sphingomonas sp. SORGH_AS_0789]MDR6149644.1 AcrR family transcriptional regulator [Sphingomonas sp. SORGH_AS_0742]
MARKPNIASKKQPRQARAVATVAAIVEAATYILSRGGLADFTSNKVAERAGVNVASFYQYFPNKEALLFHIVTKTWAEQFARLEPILTDGGASPAERLRAFVRELILVEAAEVELRRGLRAASVELRETPEFKALLERGTALFHRFLADALRDRVPEALDFTVETTAILITSFTEHATDELGATDRLLQQADFLADLLIGRFGLD